MAGADMIVGVDINPDKRDMAEKFGTTHFVNPNEIQGDVVAHLVELTGRSVALNHASSASAASS